MTFQAIHKKYDDIFKENLKKGKFPMRTTDYGFWGTAPVMGLYEFFTKVQLDRYENFLDLGSGDGRAVLLASLFTKATGIEGDPKLVEMSNRIKKDLQLEGEFICADFMKHDFSKYDFIFINPDKGFTEEFEKKIASEIKGKFYVFNKIYEPNLLERGPTMWMDQVPVTHYSRG